MNRYIILTFILLIVSSLTARFDIRCIVNEIRIEDENYVMNKLVIEEVFRIYDNINSKYMQEYEANHGNIYRFHVEKKNTIEWKGDYPVICKAEYEIDCQIDGEHITRTFSFSELFYVEELDFDRATVKLKRSRGSESFVLDIIDFEKKFIWYTDMLDKQRLYLPMLGFLSLPEGETKIFRPKKGPIGNPGYKYDSATIESTTKGFEYDFYRILDYDNSSKCFLVGRQGYVEFDPDGGLPTQIGWVPAEYVLVWRSRRYFKPINENAQYYTDQNGSFNPVHTKEINDYYYRQEFMQDPLIQEMKRTTYPEINHLGKFYKNFGFPQLYPPYDPLNSGEYTKVGIIGTFSTKLVKMIMQKIKQDVNVYYLIDNSTSMQKFGSFVDVFLNKFKAKDFGYKKNKRFIYQDRKSKPYVRKLKHNEAIPWGNTTKDNDYKECLLNGLEYVLEDIGKSIENGWTQRTEMKIIFVLTDAGANDANLMERVSSYINDQQVTIVFVNPASGLISSSAGKNMADTPHTAFNRLNQNISSLRKHSSRYICNYTFKNNTTEAINTEAAAIVDEIHRQVIGIENESDNIQSGSNILSFIPQSLIKIISKIQAEKNINSHILRYIANDVNEQHNNFEIRYAIPSQLASSYVQSSDIDFAMFKKMLIINNFIFVIDPKRIETIYTQVAKLLSETENPESDEVIEQLFITAISGGDVGNPTMRNIRNISKESLTNKLGNNNNENSSVTWFFNCWKQDSENKYIYLTDNEFFSR